MTLMARRPARLLSSLQGEDPAEVAVGLPGLPRGVTLDPQVLRDAACGEQDLELFYPDPGDTAAEQAAQRATAATGIDPAQLRAPGGRSMAAHLLGDASATVRAWELCKTAGTAHVARLIGVHVTDLHTALEHWGLEVPRLRQPAELVEDPVAAREAFGLVEQVGWVKGAQQLHVHRRTLRAA